MKGGRDDDSGGDDPDDGGVQSDTSYVSPQYGVELDWGTSWEIDAEVDSPITSDTSSGIDSLALEPLEGGGYLSVMFIDAGDTGVADLVEVWESPDFVADSAFSAEAEVVLSDSSRNVGSTVHRDFLEDGTELVVFREAALAGDNTMVVVQFSTVPSNLASVLSSAQEDMTLNGEPVFAFFAIADILDESGS